MKALPCLTRGCLGAQAGRAALGRAIVELPGGAPYTIGRPGGFPLVVKCARCKRPSRFSQIDFNRLPELTVDQIKGLGLLEAISKDWVGDGHTKAQAEDLMRAGFTLHDLRALPAQEREA